MIFFLMLFAASAFGQDVSQLHWAINQHRASKDLVLLTTTDSLDCVAINHATDLYENDFCSHTGSDGKTLRQRAKDCKATALAELIACGYNNPDSIVKEWLKNSRGRKILECKDCLALGIGQVGPYWVVVTN